MSKEKNRKQGRDFSTKKQIEKIIKSVPDLKSQLLKSTQV